MKILEGWVTKASQALASSHYVQMTGIHAGRSCLLRQMVWKYGKCLIVESYGNIRCNWNKSRKDFAKILCGKDVGSENLLSPRT